MRIRYSKLFVGISLPALCTGLASLLLFTSANAQTIRPSTQKELKVFDPTTNGTGNIGLRAAAGTSSYTLTLPASAPSVNQVLSASAVTGGNVSLTWATPVSGTVTSVGSNSGTGLTGGPITGAGTLAIDTVLISTRLWRKKGIDSVQANLTAGLATKVNISDTASMLSPYARTNAVNAGLALKVNISDTSSMLSPYARKNFLNAGTGISYSSTTGTIANTAPDQTVALNAGTGISISGTYPNFTITNSSPSSGGTVTSVGSNNGTGLTGGPITTSGTLAIDTITISTRRWRQKGIDSVQANLTSGLATKLNISDTANMLSPYARTNVVNAGLALKVNISDTASMLNPYLRKIDTTSMLSPYLRSNVAAATYVPQTRTITINGTTQDLTANRTYNVGTVTSVATSAGTGITGGTFTTSGTIAADTLLLSTRAWRQKGIDSVAALPRVTSVATNTATGITGGTIVSTGTLAIDTALIATRAWRKKGDDSVAALLSGYVPTSRTITINGTSQDLSVNRTYSVGTVTQVSSGTGLSGGTITGSGTLAVDTLLISTRAWRQKGIDSVAALANTKVSSVSGTAPISSSGGTSPTISISQASGSANGFLTSSDWTTFNNKQNAITLTTTGTSGAATLVGATLNIPQYQAALTNPVTGTGTLNYLSKFATAGTLTNSLLFDNGTGVGIGTASPSQKLHISENNTTAYSSSSASLIQPDGGANLLIQNTGTAGFSSLRFISLNGSNASGYIGFINNSSVVGSFVFGQRNGTTGYTEQMRLDGSGNLGLGTTTIGSKLQVNGNAAIGYSASTAAPTNGLAVSGNVGIGTTSPTAKLHIVGYTGSPEYRGFIITNTSNATLTNESLFQAVTADWTSSNSPEFLFRDDRSNQVTTQRIFEVQGARSGVGTILTTLANGNVGIGTTSPSGNGVGGSPTVLQINSSSTSVAVLGLSNQDNSNGAVPGVIAFVSGGLSGADKRISEIAAIKGDASTSTPNGSLTFATANSSTLSERMRITSGGNVGIGTTSPSQALDVNGNARFRSVGSGTTQSVLSVMADGTLSVSSSDLRLKTNITTIDNALEKVMKLRGVNFNWKDTSNKVRSTGFIAQEVLSVMPELVFRNNFDGYYGVNYGQAAGLFVEAIKEQQKIIDQLKADQVNALLQLRQLQNEIQSMRKNQTPHHP